MKRVTKNSAWKAALSKSLKGRTHSADRIAAIINGVKNSRREHRKMTKPEIWVADVLKLIFGKNYEIYKYTGDRKFWINTSDAKYRNPDFINEHDKKIIEVFGRYWHRNDNPDEVISEYKKAGWDCLIIWDDEINGSIVDDIEFFTYPYDVIERQKQLA